MLHNILLRISLESLKRNILLSLSCTQSQETAGWWRVVSNTLMSFCWLCKNMLSSEPLLTPARRSYRRKWSTLACSSWTAGRSAGTWHVYLSKLWRSPAVWVFFLLQLTLQVFSLITLSPPPTPPLFLRNLIYYQRIHNSRKISPQAFPPSCQVLSLTPFSPTFISGSSPMPCSQHLWRNIQPPPLCRFLLQHNGALALRSVLLQWTLFVLMYPHYLAPPFSLLLPVAMVSPCGGEHGEHGLTWREKLPPTLKLRQGVT